MIFIFVFFFARGQVVGWPPVRYYRRHALTKPSEMFVKVNMDGVAVGRKVDLNAYSSYERLLQALEEMFQPTAGKASYSYCFISYGCFIISNGSFILLVCINLLGNSLSQLLFDLLILRNNSLN